jgi:hypothetical protein
MTLICDSFFWSSGSIYYTFQKIAF